MKKDYVITGVLLALLLLAGCGQSRETGGPAPEVEQEKTETHREEEPEALDVWTEDRLSRYFLEQEGEEAAACVLAQDGTYDLIGVVQYLDLEEKSCGLAFLDREGFFQKTSLQGVEVTADRAFSYEGNGTVAFSVRDVSTGALFDYTVTYTKNENGIQYTTRSERSADEGTDTDERKDREES